MYFVALSDIIKIIYCISYFIIEQAKLESEELSSWMHSLYNLDIDHSIRYGILNPYTLIYCLGRATVINTDYSDKTRELIFGLFL